MNKCNCGKLIDKRSKRCKSCSAKFSIKIRTKEVHKAINIRISNTLKRIGAKPPVTHRTDEANPAWKGGGYEYMHDWIVRMRGKPSTCENCGKNDLKGKKIHWANINHKYKRIINDWKRLCASCHKLHDNKLKKQNG